MQNAQTSAWPPYSKCFTSVGYHHYQSLLLLLVPKQGHVTTSGA